MVANFAVALRQTTEKRKGKTLGRERVMKTYMRKAADPRRAAKPVAQVTGSIISHPASVKKAVYRVRVYSDIWWRRRRG